MRPTLVLDVVGLTPALLDFAPHLKRLAERGAMRPLGQRLPAVTCSVQATYVTGTPPSEHGIVANGWYFRDLSEVWLWRQSNRLVEGQKLWDEARRRDPTFTVAKMFWWYNMYADVDWAVTPRPMYPADGRKLPDIHSQPPSLRHELNGLLGAFPLFKFWGPAADISSSRWIADASRHVMRTRRPTLMLTYLPHLDYALQKWGPDDPRIPAEVAAVDALCGELIAEADAQGRAILVLSEYGITPVSDAVPINLALRQAGWITIRDELGRELLDPGASAAFAVADHQVAHVYVKDPARVAEVKGLIERLDGVERVLDAAGKQAAGLAHPRSGELVAVAKADRWFSYYWWTADSKAPDFARTVDIHRKPGYDPVELFLDPAIRWPKLALAWRLLKKKLGLRTLMDVIPLDTTLVKGSHGRPTDNPQHGPLVISSEPLPAGCIAPTSVKDLILSHIFGAKSDRRAAE